MAVAAGIQRKGPLLLVVDDQPGVRRLLQEALSGEALDIHLAAGGDEALKIIKEHPPDILMVDLKMPGMSGLEVLQAAKSMGYRGEAILMTAYGEVDSPDQLKELGIHYHLTKPFDIFQLKSLLREISGLHRIS